MDALSIQKVHPPGLYFLGIGIVLPDYFFIEDGIGPSHRSPSPATSTNNWKNYIRKIRVDPCSSGAPGEAWLI
jgi:hypothetical protein